MATTKTRATSSKWEIKDRTYILLKDGTPVNYLTEHKTQSKQTSTIL